MEGKKEWVRMAREFAIDWAKRNGVVTSDVVRKYVGMPPHDVDPRAIGGVFSTKDFKPVGITTSTIPSSKGRKIRVFVLS